MVPAHRLTTSWPITIPPSGGIVRYARAFVMNDSWYRASVPAVPPRAQLQRPPARLRLGPLAGQGLDPLQGLFLDELRRLLDLSPRGLVRLRSALEFSPDFAVLFSSRYSRFNATTSGSSGNTSSALSSSAIAAVRRSDFASPRAASRCRLTIPSFASLIRALASPKYTDVSGISRN